MGEIWDMTIETMEIDILCALLLGIYAKFKLQKSEIWTKIVFAI